MTSVDAIKKIVPVTLIVLFIIVVLVFLFMPPKGKLVCELDRTPGELSINYKYSADYSLWTVRELTVEENISSKNKDTLKKYKESIEKDYKSFSKIDSINSNVEMIETSLVSSTFHIDYTNLKKDDYKSLGNSMNYKNIFVGKLKKIYTNNGASCHYE